MAIKRVIVPNIVFLLVGSVMLFLSILFYRAIDTLKPELPSETNDLK